MSHTIITGSIRAELAILRARMQAIETTLKPGQCPIEATDLLYGRQEELKSQLLEIEEAQ